MDKRAATGDGKVGMRWKKTVGEREVKKGLTDESEGSSIHKLQTGHINN